VVVRGQWRSVNQAPGPVVAGVDGSPASQAALWFAFEEATLRDVPLIAVCALADAPGRLGVARQMEEDFSHLMTRCEGMSLGSVAATLLHHSPCPVAVVHPPGVVWP
jgi:nucleotide-binding universal stress UspA family protein